MTEAFCSTENIRGKVKNKRQGVKNHRHVAVTTYVVASRSSLTGTGEHVRTVSYFSCLCHFE